MPLVPAVKGHQFLCCTLLLLSLAWLDKAAHVPGRRQLDGVCQCIHYKFLSDMKSFPCPEIHWVLPTVPGPDFLVMCIQMLVPSQQSKGVVPCQRLDSSKTTSRI